MFLLAIACTIEFKFETIAPGSHRRVVHFGVFFNQLNKSRRVCCEQTYNFMAY